MSVADVVVGVSSSLFRRHGEGRMEAKTFDDVSGRAGQLTHSS